ncbi:nucleotidyltransferase domain-containing protein [Rhizobium leguminosarum bv. viciae]|uniref:nucleotidyltransferase domain-containing protein n=1 Tax=Rhizobium leguminosarum TaxID=384 RepID=UPI0010405A21|nr:nucleotidyltransferase domain-containing protein [Rhizobium leguminosarum]TBY65761.1 nucleotidyltransferase domain-containing protein [Rhizobium leguminosarum bv. viciae]
MTIEAIFLYGSWARGDQGEKSDNDLLMVTDEGRSYHVTDGHHSMTYYPLAALKEMARQGDLFVYHIVLEAKSVFDPNGILEILRGVFRAKESYRVEISHGGDLGWYLVHHHQSLSPTLVAKRIAWSVRTILIAKSAMLGRPVFAPDTLVSLSTFRETKQLIATRHGNFTPEAVPTLRSFLSFEGLPDPLGPHASEPAWRRHFAETANRVGVQLLRQLGEQSAVSAYE